MTPIDRYVMDYLLYHLRPYGLHTTPVDKSSCGESSSSPPTLSRGDEGNIDSVGQRDSGPFNDNIITTDLNQFSSKSSPHENNQRVPGVTDQT